MLSVARASTIRVGPGISAMQIMFDTVSMSIPVPSHSSVLILHEPSAALRPIVVDSPHSGFTIPPDFNAALPHFDLRDGEDCFIDTLWSGTIAKGIPLLAAQFPRTYVDANRHEADIDLDLIDGAWNGSFQPSGKAALGKAVVWRTLDDGRPIYTRRLSVQEVESRLQHYHRPYHAALRALLDSAHVQFGAVWHLNCHSMNPVAGASGEGGEGSKRADVVLGDRDGSTCAPEFTAVVRAAFERHGYGVKVNDPFKGVELVRAYSNPAAGRHSLQVELNKNLYMNPQTRERHEGFAVLQSNLMAVLDEIDAYTRSR